MGNPPPLKKVIHIPDNEGGELETRHHLVIISFELYSKMFKLDQKDIVYGVLSIGVHTWYRLL